MTNHALNDGNRNLVPNLTPVNYELAFVLTSTITLAVIKAA